MAKSCPVCSLSVGGDDGDYEAHVNVCLDRQTPALAGKGAADAPCQICGKDLSRYSTAQRTQHVNRCCDSSETLSSVAESSAYDEEVDFVVSEAGRRNLRVCQLCGKSCRNKQGLIQHVKKCASQPGSRHSDGMAPSKASTMGDVLTSESSNLCDGAGGRRTRSRLKRMKDAADEEMELAMAMSKSLQQQEDDCLRFLEPSKKKIRGARKGSVPETVPLLLQRSRAEGDRLVQARAEQVLFVDDEDTAISCTPALGVSNVNVVTPQKSTLAVEGDDSDDGSEVLITSGPSELHSHVGSSGKCLSSPKAKGTCSADELLLTAGGFSADAEEQCLPLVKGTPTKVQMEKRPARSCHHQLHTEDKTVYIEDIPVADMRLLDVQYHHQLWRLSAASGPLTSSEKFYVPKLLYDVDMALSLFRNADQLATSTQDKNGKAAASGASECLHVASDTIWCETVTKTVNQDSPATYLPPVHEDHSFQDGSATGDAPTERGFVQSEDNESGNGNAEESAAGNAGEVSQDSEAGQTHQADVSSEFNVQDIPTGPSGSRLSSVSTSSLRLHPKSSSTPRNVSVHARTFYVTPVVRPGDCLSSGAEPVKGSVNNSPEHRVVSDFALLVNKPWLSDVSVVAKDGKQLFAHQVLLAARSPALARVFTSEESDQKSFEDSWQLGHGAVLRFDDMHSDVLLSLLQYLYSGSVSFPSHHLPPLLSLAERLELPWLADHCLGVLSSADHCTTTALQQKCNGEKEADGHQVTVLGSSGLVVQSEKNGDEVTAFEGIQMTTQSPMTFRSAVGEDLCEQPAKLLSACEAQSPLRSLSPSISNCPSPHENVLPVKSVASDEKVATSPQSVYSRGSSPCLFDSDCDQGQRSVVVLLDDNSCSSSTADQECDESRLKNSQDSSVLQSLTPPTLLATPILPSQSSDFPVQSSTHSSPAAQLSIQLPTNPTPSEYPCSSHVKTFASPQLVQLSDEDEDGDELVDILPTPLTQVENDEDDDCVVEKIVPARQVSPSHSDISISPEHNAKQKSHLPLQESCTPHEVSHCPDKMAREEATGSEEEGDFSYAFVHDDDGFNCDLDMDYRSLSECAQSSPVAAHGDRSPCAHSSPASCTLSDLDPDSPHVVNDLHNSTLLAAVEFSDDSVSGSGSSKVMQTPVHSKASSLSAVTPMLNYDAMATPTVRAEAERFGIKKLSKKNTVHLLKHIYKYTHSDKPQQGYVEISETDEPDARVDASVKSTHVGDQCGSPQQSPEADHIPQTRGSNLGEINNDLFSEEDADANCCTVSSESSDGEADLTKEFGCDFELSPVDNVEYPSQVRQVSQKEQLRGFLFKHDEFYEQILQYQPLSFYVLKKSLAAAKISVSERQLVSFLDEQCIAFSTGPRTRTTRNTSK